MADFDISSAFIPALHKPASLLPITKHHDLILYLVETYPVTIVVGETGSGKTTQIPQFLEKAGWCSGGKVIAVTQVCPVNTQSFYIHHAASLHIAFFYGSMANLLLSLAELQRPPRLYESLKSLAAKPERKSVTRSGSRISQVHRHGSSLSPMVYLSGKPSWTPCCPSIPSSWSTRPTRDLSAQIFY